MNISNESYANLYHINQATKEEAWKGYSPNFSYYASICKPDYFPGRSYPWHWHGYVQFFLVLKGQITYQLQNCTKTFFQGDGGFINSNALHTLTANCSKDACYIEELFYPTFIGGSSKNDIMRHYVTPITENTSFDVFRFEKDRPAHKKILDIIEEIYQIYEKKEECYELILHSKLTSLWADFYKITKSHRDHLVHQPSSERLKAMLLFINEHYTEKITLDDIAHAGTCSKRECNRAFQSQLHITPFQYLIQIRLNKAATLLDNSNVSITHISESCGFTDSSHFTKAFKAQYGITPKQYRNGDKL